MYLIGCMQFDHLRSALQRLLLSFGISGVALGVFGLLHVYEWGRGIHLEGLYKGPVLLGCTVLLLLLLGHRCRRRGQDNALRLLLSCGISGVTLGIFGLLHLYEWNRGLYKGLVLLGCTVLLLLLLGYTLRRRSQEPARESEDVAALLGWVWRWLLLSFVALALYYFWTHTYLTPIDIGTTSYTAVHVFFDRFDNPYASPVDPKVPPGEGFRFGNGYKYLPLTFLAYAPLTLRLGMQGIYWTHAIVYPLSLVALFLLARALLRHAPAYYPMQAVALFAGTYLVWDDLFASGVNDILPTTCLILSLSALGRDKVPLAAFWAGLSCCFKPMPGVFLIVFLFPDGYRQARFWVALLLPMVMVDLPFFLWAPREMIGSLIIYFQEKPPDTTGMVLFLPMWLRGVWPWLGRLCLLGTFGAYFWLIQRQPHLRATTTGRLEVTVLFYTIVVTVFFIFLKENHRNHLMWILPFYALLACWGQTIIANLCGLSRVSTGSFRAGEWAGNKNMTVI